MRIKEANCNGLPMHAQTFDMFEKYQMFASLAE
jgi:hypothetical protein